MTAPEVLDAFHPVIAEWFGRRFDEGPTEAQSLGWPLIAKDRNTLIAAPTGSGKTLAAFLVAIDKCLKAPNAGTSVLYVSPLRALTVDVSENLEAPLREIRALAQEKGIELPDVRVAVRNGDTTPSRRAAMLRERPEIVVTTPESLYLLLGTARGRSLLETVDTVIVDEIHALARDKRGAHLALSLERLDGLVESRGRHRPVRVGCSATQKPIEMIARLLVGERKERGAPPSCAIVDVGHQRKLDLDLRLVGDELGAVTTAEQLEDLVELLAQEIVEHRTTLIFVNTRKMSERLAHLLAERLGEQVVAAHHGSLSANRRLIVEKKLRDGELAAVVATASLELGIDIGPVDLVCQISSPRSIATLLQRVGRADHNRHGLPTGRVYPLTRDELVECVALLAATRAGALDAIEPPRAPLDILAQQVVAEVAAREEGVTEEELFELCRRATPYAGLSRASFDEVVQLVSEGVETGRGRRGAHLHRDRVHGMLRPRRGARLTALTSGGAIPELAGYRVVTEPDDAIVGTVHEDFAVEVMRGDVFLLGSSAWRVRRVEQGVVRVADAGDAAVTVPFWLGEAPARTEELSSFVSELRTLVESELDRGGTAAASTAVRNWAGVCDRAADEVTAYLAAAKAELGVLPTRHHVVYERFFDDSGGMQLVIHAPFGARVNRGLGLALRKRFCRTFDFELQAAANDDAIVLSLGPQHAFPLEDLPYFLSSGSVGQVLTQALLPTPIFTSRWRWNLGRSLVSPRFRGGRHLPPAIQRMEADDLLAAVFPSLAACQENVTGPIELPDHLLVRQSISDCLSEATDLERVVEVVTALRSGEIETSFRDTTSASLLAHEICSGRPFTFLDDAPLEERRTRAATLRRGIPQRPDDLAHIPDDVIADVALQLRPEPRNADELADLLQTLVIAPPRSDWAAQYAELESTGRALTIKAGERSFWCATERRPVAEVLFPAAQFRPDYHLEEGAAPSSSDEEAAEAVIAGHLEFTGPTRADELALAVGLSEALTERALLRIEARGGLLRVPPERYCARRILFRLHAAAREQIGRRYAPVSVQHFVRFLLDWQHVAPHTKLSGTDGLRFVLGQLQGVEVAIGSWEESVLPARITGYHAAMLDELCAAGELAWGRLSLRPDVVARPNRGRATPSRATPVALVRRYDLSLLLAAVRGTEKGPVTTPGASGELLEVLSEKGALFFSDLCAETQRLPDEVAEALWDLVQRGLVTSDGFSAVRALLLAKRRSAGRYETRRPLEERYRRAGVSRRTTMALSRRDVPPTLSGGRWSLLRQTRPERPVDELAEAVATQLLERWGVVFFDVVRREPFNIAWREVLLALRRFEARGVVRGGRFVAGVAGEQYALPEALEALRRVSRRPLSRSVVRLSGTDPLNVSGLFGESDRVPAVRGHDLVLVDGLAVSRVDVEQPSRVQMNARPSLSERSGLGTLI